jgi:hypothetical protein
MTVISETESPRKLTTANLSQVEIERIADRTNANLKLHPLNVERAPHLEYLSEKGEIVADIRLNGTETTMVFPGIGRLNFPKPLRVEFGSGKISFINEEAVQIPGDNPENEFEKLIIRDNGEFELFRRS